MGSPNIGRNPRRLAPGQRARGHTTGPPNISEKNTAHLRMYTPRPVKHKEERRNTKKKGDLCGEGKGCGRGEKTRRVLVELKQKRN